MPPRKKKKGKPPEEITPTAYGREGAYWPTEKALAELNVRDQFCDSGAVQPGKRNTSDTKTWNVKTTPKDLTEVPSDVVSVMEPLTARQRVFVLEYLRTKNAKQAALIAGYAPRHAHNQSITLLRKDHVVRAIAALTKAVTTEVVKEIAFTHADVLQKLLGMLDMALRGTDLDGKPVIASVTKSGIPIERGPDLRSAAAIMKMIGEHVDVACWVTRTDVTSGGKPLEAPQTYVLHVGDQEVRFSGA